MNVTVYRREAAGADITVYDIGGYLAGTGWELVHLCEWRDVMGPFRLAKWKRDHDIVLLRSNSGPLELANSIEFIALLERREATAVLADVAGQPRSDRGRLINANVSAGAHLVEAKEAFQRARGEEEKARAMFRVTEAAAELERATKALDEAGGP